MKKAMAVCALLLLRMFVFDTATGLAATTEKREMVTPSFSIEAAQVVYVEEVTPPGAILPATSEIWTMFSDGSGARRLTQGFKDELPRFRPDSKQIVFVRDLQLWLVNVDGTALRRVSNKTAFFEDGALFSNDAQTLFYVRPAEDEFTEKDLDADPLISLAIGLVPVQYDLKTGKERVLLDEDYGVLQIAPNPSDDKTVFVLCNELDNNGKPKPSEEKAIAVLPLQGAALPRSVFVPDKEYKLAGLRVSTTNNVVEASTKGEFSKYVYVVQGGTLLKVEELSFLGDISLDGKIVLGTALDEKFRWRVALYDIATKKQTLLKKRDD